MTQGILNNSINISEENLYIYPELIAIAEKRKLLDKYICWHLLKLIDKKKGNSGYFNIKSILSIINYLFGVGNSQCYKIFNDGIDIFWNKPSNIKGHRYTGLKSSNKVINFLQPDMTRTKPFKIKVKDLISPNKQNQKRYLVNKLTGFVAARNTKIKPIAHSIIQEQMGISKSTVKRRLSECPGLVIAPNCKQIYAGKSYEEAKLFLENFDFNKEKNPCRVTKIDEKYYITQQIGNSYVLPEYTRISNRKRPKQLRVFDNENYANGKSKIFIDSSKKNVNNSEITYVQGGIKYLNNFGKVVFWKSNRKYDLEHLPPIKQFVKRWEIYKLNIDNIDNEKE